MSKATKLIIATIALGGLGYFLYKRGMFTKSVSEVVEIDKAKIEKDLADAMDDKVQQVKPAVEPPEVLVKVPIYDPNTDQLVYDTVIGTPIQVPVVNPVYNDSYYEAVVYPTVNDTYGGLKPIENDYIVNPTVQQDWWNQGSYNVDFKLGIDENYKYK